MIRAVMSDLYIPPSSYAPSQISCEEPLRGEGPRDQKSPGFLVAPPAPKISKILESLIFLRGSKISEILEPLGGPQEAF